MKKNLLITLVALACAHTTIQSSHNFRQTAADLSDALEKLPNVPSSTTQTSSLEKKAHILSTKAVASEENAKELVRTAGQMRKNAAESDSVSERNTLMEQAIASLKQAKQEMLQAKALRKKQEHLEKKAFRRLAGQRTW